MKHKQHIGSLEWLRLSWLLRSLIVLLCYAFSPALALYAILQFFGLFDLNTILWICSGLFAGLFLILFLRSKLWKIRLKDLAHHLNNQYPTLEHSTQLLLKDTVQLNTLEQLQLERVQKAYADIRYKKSLPVQMSRAFGLLFMAALLAFSLNLIDISPASATMGVPLLYEENPTDSIKIKGKPISNKPLKLIDAQVEIIPPAYTGKKARQQPFNHLQVEENALVKWTITMNQGVKNAEIFLGEEERYDMIPIGNRMFEFKKQFTESAYFHLLVYPMRSQSNLISDFYKLEVIKDQKPIVRIQEPEQYITIDGITQKQFTIEAEAQDDYGIAEAYIIATVTKGEGESVKFREEKIPFEKQRKQGAKKRTYKTTISLDQLEVELGDEIYYYVEALDNCLPKTNWGRSDVYYVSIPDTTEQAEFDLSGISLDILPDYFRSQRQLIIDTEKLLKEKYQLSLSEFNKRSNGLAADQKALRLRYGQFLGEEAVSDGGGGGHGHHHEEEGPDEDGNFHGHHHGHQHGKAKKKKKKPKKAAKKKDIKADSSIAQKDTVQDLVKAIQEDKDSLHSHHDHAHEDHDSLHSHHDHVHEDHDSLHSHHEHDHEEGDSLHSHHDHAHEENDSLHSHHDHAHEDHDSLHSHHDHAHEDHDSLHSHHEHAHEDHDSLHSHHEHDHEGHNHDHEGHDHDHEGHDHDHEGHDHDHEGHDDDHEGHDHDHEGHDQDHEGHDQDHEGHDQDHEGHDDDHEEGATTAEEEEHDHEEDEEAHEHDHEGHDHDDHDHEEEAFEISAPSSVADYMHMHDNIEETTFFSLEITTKLKNALANMWDAELFLRMNQPEKALAYERKALTIIKEVQQKSRIYVHRVGFEPTPLKPVQNRYKGELKDIRNIDKIRDLEVKQQYVYCKKALPLLAKLLEKSNELKADQRVILEGAAKELARETLLQRGNYLQAMQQFRQFLDNYDRDASFCSSCLKVFEKAIWQVVPQPNKPQSLSKNVGREWTRVYFERLY